MAKHMYREERSTGRRILYYGLSFFSGISEHSNNSLACDCRIEIPENQYNLEVGHYLHTVYIILLLDSELGSTCNSGNSGRRMTLCVQVRTDRWQSSIQTVCK